MATLNFPNSPAYGDTYDKYKWDGEKWCLTIGGRLAAAPNSAEAMAFLARTSGLNAAHIDAYNVLIDGLVLDGIWAKLDVLHVYATQDSTTALLNLVSTSYTGTYIGTAPTFTVDRGFSGSEGISSQLIDTNFNPATAVSPKSVQNSAHVSAWPLSNMTSTMMVMGANQASGWASGIYAKYNDNNAYFYSNTTTNLTVTSIADSVGHYISNRSGVNNREAYKNGASVATTTSDASVAPSSFSIRAVGYYLSSAGDRSSGNQVAMVSIGSSLNGTDATNFYNRLRGYLTLVGGNTIAGPGSMVVPAGKTTLVGEAWGAGGTGGGGGTSVGTGGGGGGYSRFTTSVTPGQVIYYNVGAGVVGVSGAGSAGGNSWVNPAANSQPTSNGCVGGGGGGSDGGGVNGVGGVGTIGTTNFTGGVGGFGSNPQGGGGGGCAGSAGNGGAASGHAAGVGGTPDGAPGMAGGGNGNFPSAAPGGGGGGSWGFNAGDSANGQVRLTFT